MKPNILTIHDLFQKERRYTVPLYQRSYVWNRQDQWQPLWEDIERQAEDCLSAPPKFTARRSHFLGAIVLNVEKIVGGDVARSEVIDGQQHITTLQLFLAALRDYAILIGSSHAGKLQRLTTNEDEKPDSEGRFKVWPTNADRDVFEAVVTSQSPSGVMHALGATSADAMPRVAGAYMFFSDAVREFIGSDSDTLEAKDHRIFGLLQALRTALQLVVIELEASDDPQVIFETLNARGQPLLPSDLIRNYVFLQASNNDDLDTDELYNQFWRDFDDRRLETIIDGEDRFWHVLERQGRLTRPRIDLFMFHYLAMKTERDLNIGQLYREFRDWRDETPEPVQTFLADLRAHSRIFADIIAPTAHDRPATFARRLKSLDTTAYPVFMYLMALPRSYLPVATRDQILEDLESWMVRRLVCQLTNKNYNRFFLQLLSAIKKASSATELAVAVRTELTRSTDPTLKWPDDDEFRRGWLSRPMYVKSRPDRSNMLLNALEQKIRTSKNETVVLGGSLTVEHYLPQKGALSDYPFPDPMPKNAMDANDTLESCRARLIHTMGNLTLLTQELNSSVSNGPFPRKVRRSLRTATCVSTRGFAEARWRPGRKLTFCAAAKNSSNPHAPFGPFPAAATDDFAHLKSIEVK